MQALMRVCRERALISSILARTDSWIDAGSASKVLEKVGDQICSAAATRT